MLIRLIDTLKLRKITTVCTSLTAADGAVEQTPADISSLMDTWLLLRDLETNGEHNRGLYILKSRGMGHSNQIREVLISDRGIELVDIDPGSSGFLTGSARLARTAQERDDAMARQHELDRAQRDLKRKHAALDAQIALLRAEYQREADEVQDTLAQLRQRENRAQADRTEMGRQRQADNVSAPRPAPQVHAKGARR
jgi:circadian clock protein KaiC